jgi:hypothetical protein
LPSWLQYGKTALGMRLDAIHDEFMKNTKSLRMKGFKMYLASLGLFLVELVLVSAERIEDELRYPYVVGALVIAGFMFKDGREIMRKGAPIFTEDLGKETDSKMRPSSKTEARGAERFNVK